MLTVNSSAKFNKLFRRAFIFPGMSNSPNLDRVIRIFALLFLIRYIKK